MTLQQLRYVTVVAETGTISGAAKALFISQPSLTAAIQELEKELGITKEADSFSAYTKWYNSANTGMGACLVMAEELGAYILTDKATFLTFVANDGVIG